MKLLRHECNFDSLVQENEVTVFFGLFCFLADASEFRTKESWTRSAEVSLRIDPSLKETGNNALGLLSLIYKMHTSLIELRKYSCRSSLFSLTQSKYGTRTIATP